MNHIITNNYASAKPIVGMGATEMGYSDRHAYTISWIHPNGKWAMVQRDCAKRSDDNGMSEMQHYEYMPQPESLNIPIKLYKDGHWHIVAFDEWSRSSHKGNVVMIGKREEYYDYSF